MVYRLQAKDFMVEDDGVEQTADNSRSNYMKHTRGCLLLRVTCPVCLLGMAPVAITAQGQTFAYVANAHSDSVSVIDTASNTVTATVAVGCIPFWLAITPDGTRAFVANGADGTVSVVDTASNTVMATVAVGSVPLWGDDHPGRSPRVRDE